MRQDRAPQQSRPVEHVPWTIEQLLEQSTEMYCQSLQLPELGPDVEPLSHVELLPHQPQPA